MSNFLERYKERKVGFGDNALNRIIRAKERDDLRRKQRNISFNQGRNISVSAVNKTEKEGVQPAPANADRLIRLKKWKVERDRHKRIEQMKKKPPFVVGVVHHKIYSPVTTNDQTLVANVKHEKVRNQTAPASTASPLKRVTRATQKRLLKKALVSKSVNNSNKSPKPVNKEQKKKIKQVNESFAPVDHKFKAPAGLSHIPLFGRVAIQSMSPARMSGFMSSFIKTSDVSRKSGISQFNVENVSNNESNIPVINEQKNEDDLEESYIEPVTLRLSSDEGNETFTYENNDSNVSDSKVKVQDNSVRNNSIAEISSSSIKNISTPNNSQLEPAAFSPYVVSSRGKSNARKEQQLKRGFSLNRSQIDDIPTKDTIMKTLNISVEEEERTAQYFRFLLNKEIDRLNELCNKWTDIKEDPETSEDGQYEINQAIGQTNLLINKKFERFRRLVADCETGKGEMLVTCKDLQGFWDMMYMEVKDCDARFGKLEKLRSQNWVEEQSPVVKNVSVKKKKPVARKKVVPTKSSSLRTFLSKKKKNVLQKARNNDNTEESDIAENQDLNNKRNSNVRHSSRMSTSLLEKCTPGKQGRTKVSLLQTEESSAVSKSMKSPLTLIKVSQMCKTPDVTSYINSKQTPGKSILKQPKNSSKVDLSAKSISKVNFDDDVVLNSIPVNEKAKVKIDLAKALFRIDSFEFESPDDAPINAERKLIFDDNSFDETKDDTKLDIELANTTEKVPIIKLQTATPLKMDSSDTQPSKSLTRQDAVDEIDKLNNDLIEKATLTRPDEPFDLKDTSPRTEKPQKRVSMRVREEPGVHDESVRVLRNRIVVSGDTPRSRRSSKKSINVQELEQKENKTPVKTRRRSSVKIPLEDKEEDDLQDSLDKSSDKRKSLRSVKFSENCTACVTNKSTLPMTPYIRRSKVKSTGKKKSTMSENLISWETPEPCPDRVRRSRNRRTESLI